MRDILTSLIETLDSDDGDEDEAICNAVVNCFGPPNYAAAMKTPKAEQWCIAIESELMSLRDNRTWIVV